MPKPAKNVTVSPPRGIAFKQLVLSKSNVRHIKAGISVEELAKGIARRGLLQYLSVRRVLSDDGSETDKFRIRVGGRRFSALSLLVKQKRLAKKRPIPCIVRDAYSRILAENDSIAEDMQSAALHPLDQFRAFVALLDKSQGDEEVVAAFFVTPLVVNQRMILASVSPALLAVYAEDEMTLEQLTALTVNPDHEGQVWDSVRSFLQNEPYQTRRRLIKASVRISMLDIVEATQDLKPYLGVNDRTRVALAHARGPELADVTVLTIDANRNHPTHVVKKPGGAIRAMLKQFRRKKLNLVGSLIGLSRRCGV